MKWTWKKKYSLEVSEEDYLIDWHFIKLGTVPINKSNFTPQEEVWQSVGNQKLKGVMCPCDQGRWPLSYLAT